VFFLGFYLMFPYLINKLTYPTPLIAVPSPPPSPYREVVIEYAANDSITCWSFQNQLVPKSTPIILMFHGNGENLKTMHLGGLLDEFRNLKVNFLAVDYPGYGRSTGKPSETAILKSANSAYNWIKNSYPENPCIIFGWSLGAAVAIQIAAENESGVDALIAVSPWTTLADVASAHYPKLVVRSLLNEKYDSVEATKKISCSSLIIHGENDLIIPMEQGEKIAKSLGKTAKWLQVPNVGHNDIFSNQNVWTEISNFIARFNAQL
jgi:pimeloyl-ACP methyl ester carboxylesterase